MNQSRLPYVLRLLTALALLALISGAALWLWRQAGLSPPATRVTERSTLTVLHSRPVLMLTTRRVVFQVVIEHAESSWSGQWHGVLWAIVEIRYGVDLQQLGPGDLRRDGRTTVVRLPEPALLGFSIEPGSVGFLSKSTAVPRMADLLGSGSQRRLLEGRLREQALAFAAEHELLPTREAMIEQLDEAVAPLAQASGGDIRFE